MSRAVAQWLVRATDDRVVAGCVSHIPSDIASVAASKLGALGKFVYHTSRTSVVPVHIVHSDEVVSLISGDYSVVGSPMQWMLQSMCCYET